MKGHQEILLDAHSVIQAQKRDAALAIRGISLIQRLQGMQSSVRHVTGVKITGIGEAYDIGLHGVVYQVNKWDPKQFDWTKKLADADYVGPTCQYCHMRGGHHNVQRFSTVYASMGMSMADRGAPIWKEKRDRWASFCDDCHSPRFAKENLQAMDESVKDAGLKYRETFQVAADLVKDGFAGSYAKRSCA